LGERCFCTAEVEGSIPSGSTNFYLLEKANYMKIMKLLFIKIIFYIVVLSAISFVFFYLPVGNTSPERIKTCYIIKYSYGVIDLIVFILSIVDVIFGIWYEKITYIPMKEIHIEKYNNLYLVRYRDEAFAIALYNNSWLKKDKVRVRDFYNRKKNHISWQIDLPYMKSR
jgi:hypothetical protein